MKNREKYRDKIIKSARTPEERLNVCEFIRINVLPHFGAELHGDDSGETV